MSRTETYARWTADETNFLVENYGIKSADVIARELGRTVDSVWSKSERLGLRKHAKRQKRDPDGPWLCHKCGKTKDKSQFGSAPGGRGSAYCLVCTNRLQRERRKANKKRTTAPRKDKA